jgi:hypothetical protein
MNSFGKKHTMHVGAERPDPLGLSFGRYTCFLLIPQALNSSLLASSQAMWAPFSFLPDIFTLLLFMINPLLISISFSWVIIHFIYFYAPPVTGMYPSNSFLDGSAIDSILPIFSVFVTAFRAIVQRGEFQTLIPAVPEKRTSSMCTLLFSCMFFLFSPVRFFFFSSSYFCFW